MDIPIIGARPVEQKQIEVCRSFSGKLSLENYGGKKFETRDFFSSRKMTCNFEDRAWVSQELYEECVSEVQQAMAAYVEKMAKRRARMAS